MRPNHHGFSLLEALISLAIIGILTSLSSPFFSFIEREKAILAANDLKHFLALARSTAATHGQITSVCASFDNEQCNGRKNWSASNLLIFIDPNKNGQVDAGEHIVRILTWAEYGDRSLWWRSFKNKSYLVFLPNGLSDHQNGNFTFFLTKKRQFDVFLSKNRQVDVFFLSKKLQVDVFDQKT